MMEARTLRNVDGYAIVMLLSIFDPTRFAVPLPGIKSPKAVIVSVHASGANQVLRNLARADEAGADGVFLLNHPTRFGDKTLTPEQLADLIERVAPRSSRKLWLGVNFLNTGNASRISHINLAERCQADCLWVDDSGMLASSDWQQYSESELRHRQKYAPGLSYFGGLPTAIAASAHAGAVVQAASKFLDATVLQDKQPGSGNLADRLAAARKAFGSHPLLTTAPLNAAAAAELLQHVDGVILRPMGLDSRSRDLDTDTVRKIVETARRTEPLPAA